MSYGALLCINKVYRAARADNVACLPLGTAVIAGGPIQSLPPGYRCGTHADIFVCYILGRAIKNEYVSYRRIHAAP